MELRYYGAEVYACRARHLGPMDDALQESAKAIAPAWRTTPRNAIRREAGIPGASGYISDVRQRLTLRIQKLDPSHLLRQRAQEHSTLYQLQGSTLQNTAPPLSLPNTISPPLPIWNASPPFRDIVVYSDGSKMRNGQVGGGYHAEQARRQLFADSFSLGQQTEVYDAEMEAAVRGVTRAVHSLATNMAANIHVVLDNQAAVRNLQPGQQPILSPKIAADMAANRAAWAARNRESYIPVGSIKVWWTPGHNGLEGNEKADQLAKSGALLPSPIYSSPTLS